ncbi:MAG: hypothetical protein J2P41_11020, partial [Blastocatellia bacterium]|nr:hypothetical protein [Blastocatellia bacterium]
FHYTGDFSVHGGKITVYIVDPDNFTKFANHKKFTAFYAAEKVTDGRFDIPCQQGQIYHVIVLNDSAYDVRLVDTNFCFTHIGE